MESARDIINITNSSSSECHALIERAFNFSKKAHDKQKRFSGDPYFIHAYETAKILATLKMSPTTIAAGLLHDVFKNETINEKELEKEFGKEILFLVQGVTKLGKLKYRGTKRHRESLRKLFVAVSQDIRVIIIKLADRLHNMRTLEHVPSHKRVRIAKETLEIYVPIAYRLGIRKLNRDLEDISFQFVYPKEYEEIKNISKQKSEEDFRKLEKFQKSIKKVLAKNGITDFTIDYRIKTLYSLYHKLIRKDWNIEKIYDMSAMRIILSDVNKCYKVLGIIHGSYRPLPERIKDYIALPKPNGYQALHTTIFTGYGNVLEIQIKTKKMHQDAEYGIASHIIYKGDNNDVESGFSWIRKLLPFNNENIYNNSISEELSHEDIPRWIKELVEYQSIKKDKPELEEEELKADFFEYRIFVFTPQGDVIDLPIESSPVDFAYAIHSEIGNSMSGAKINGKLVSLDTHLKNGDIVEIITDKKKRTNKKWIEYAKTTAAKKHIRSALQKK